MNHQYIQQQQQQQQQPQPGYYTGPHSGAPPYEGLSSNVIQNLTKAPPPQMPGAPQPQLPVPPPSSMQTYPAHKPMQQGSLPLGNLPPPTHPLYYNNNSQGNTQQQGLPPPSGSPHVATSPLMTNQSNLTNQMSNMSLINQPQRAPSAQSFPPPTGNSNTISAPPPSMNGFNTPSDNSPLDPVSLNDNQQQQQQQQQQQPPPLQQQQPQQQPPQQQQQQQQVPHQPGSIGGSQGSGQMAARQSINQQGLPPSQLSSENPAFVRHSTAPIEPVGQFPLNQQQYPAGPPSMGYPSVGQQRPPVQPYMTRTASGQPNFPGQQQNIAGPPLPPSSQANLLSQQRQYVAPGPPGIPGGQPIGSSMNRPAPLSPGYPPPQQHVRPGQRQLSFTPDFYGGQPLPQQQQQQQQQQHQQQQQPLPPLQQGAMNTGYQPPGGHPQQARRLDPDQMPSPIQVMQDDERNRGGVFVTNQKGLVPPLVTTKYTTQDQGHSSPRFIRSTMYTVPTSNDMMKQTGVPFGIIISPMAQVAEGEFEPPIVDMGDIGPVRCIRCKSYMSPFMQFIEAGRRFQCMFCKATSTVPQEYFQHVDHTGQRMDRYERPELMLGTYEYKATTDYCRNNALPKPPAIIFIIDVSYNTVKSGLVNLLCSEMKRIIANLPIDAFQTRTGMKVGFITYNNTVHFYNVSSCLTQPQMMVVGDVQDVFMPLLDGFLCDAEESGAVIDALMTQIPAMFADTRETETILAPAIQAGLEALKASDRPGKLMVFHSSLPIAEAPGKLKNRDDRKVLGTEKEKTVLAPQTNVYNNLGQECVSVGCSVDLFVFNNSYVDIATIGQICRLTGGEVYKYTYFQADTDGERLITDIVNNISRPIAFDAVMRVRTSTGVRATDFYGHFFMSNTTDMELASIDCNKAVAIEIKHDDKLTDEEGVYIQAALLYTSCGGVRRLRIINLGLRTSSQMAELYRACDLDAVINFFSKQSVFKLIESSPKSVKDGLIARCATILAAYRKHCASPSSAGQLILPECMKLLPLYVNCLLKSDAISGGSDMTIDDRSYVMQAVATMPLYTSVIYFYPRLLPLHDIDPQGTELPQQLRCSFDKFMDDGAYLLENGIHMFLWLGLGLSSEWINQVFGVMLVDTDRTTLPVLDTPLNKRIRDVVARVRAERHHCMRLTIVRQREKLEMVLRHFLVEDRGNDSSPSYVDFLCHMHKEIKTLLSQ